VVEVVEVVEEVEDVDVVEDVEVVDVVVVVLKSVPSSVFDFTYNTSMPEPAKASGPETPVGSGELTSAAVPFAKRE
jgi:hypothetical protein